MEAELLRAIRERPDDDDPRLVYADWLSDRGDPRGELIVLQCKLARLDLIDRDDDERRWMDVRRRELLDAHAAEWRRGLDDIPTLSLGYLERGFVRRVALQESAFVSHADALFAAAPLLEEVFLDGGTWATPPEVPPAVARLRAIRIGSLELALAVLASPYVRTIERLEISRDCDGPSIATGIARASLERLTALDLGGTKVGAAGLRALLAWPALARLTRLDLSNCDLKGMRDFARSPGIAQLRYLSLWGNPLGTRGAIDVLTSEQLASLEELRLQETHAAGAIARCSLPKLKTLLYSHNALSVEEGEALAAATTLASLEHLDLGGHNRETLTVVAGAAAAIVASTTLPKLVSLELGGNRYGKRAASIIRAIRPGFRVLGLGWMGLEHTAAHALADQPHLAGVQHLGLANNPLDADAIEALAGSPHLRPRSLDLGFTQLGDKGVAILARSPVVSELRRLDLQGCNLTDAAAKALAESPHLGHLTRLTLYNNRLTDAGAAALATSETLPPLVALSLGANAVSPEAQRALAARGHGVR